ncbi:MAG TPA: LrgB family protein [Burkholderiaceae bacterium]
MHSQFIAPAFFAATLAIYAFSKYLYLRHRAFLFSPIVLTPLLLITMLELTHTSFAVYFQDTRWLTWLLGPATIAFAYPIYTQRALIRRYPITLTVGVAAGLVLGLASSWLLARAFALPPEVARSLLPRSVSTPFAVSAATAWGGDRNLTVICVMITGIFGASVGDVLLDRLKLRSGISRGAALGASAHGLGTSKAYELGEEEGAVASLVMVFAGVAMVLLAPAVTRFLL